MPVPKRIQLKDVQEKWKSSQQRLIDHGVKVLDANALQQAQIMTKLIASMKKHGGPLNSDEDIEKLQKNVKILPER